LEIKKITGHDLTTKYFFGRFYMSNFFKENWFKIAIIVILSYIAIQFTLVNRFIYGRYYEVAFKEAIKVGDAQRFINNTDQRNEIILDLINDPGQQRIILIVIVLLIIFLIIYMLISFSRKIINDKQEHQNRKTDIK